MLDIKIYACIIMVLITFIIFILKLIIKYSKNNKLKNNLQNLVDVSCEIIPLIKEAETYLNFDGEEKKKYVESRVLNYIYNNDIKMDSSIISESIDTLVDFTKHVNCNQVKDKTLMKLKEE